MLARRSFLRIKNARFRHILSKIPRGAVFKKNGTPESLCNPDCWIASEIISPGFWAVESDAGDDYFAQVYQEERAILPDMIASLKTSEIRA